MIKIKLLAVCITVLTTLIACGGSTGFTNNPGDGGIDSGFGNGTNDLASLDCSTATAFDPVAAGFSTPVIETQPSGMMADTMTSIILMHGKTGSPASPFLASFQIDMADMGYKVVAPVMPWSTNRWEGTLCEGMAYINQLAELEITAGREVVIAGHSMGGVYALIYGVTQPGSAVKALVTIAPGHMMHVSNLLQTTTAADVQRAKNLVSIGEGNIVKNDFVTLNNGVEIRITTTANRYLTYHDLDVVPNLNFVLPEITLPVLWFSGDTDPLTALEGMEALAATITSIGSEYQALPGDHTSVVALTPDPLDTWLDGTGSNTLATLDCTIATAFDPVAAGFSTPIVTSPDLTTLDDTNTTIILLHGKTGTPTSSFLASFQTDMTSKAYKVVAPAMPWSTNRWDGTLCEGMAYINQLSELEINAGREVVIVGHSMGGTYALLYGVTQPGSAVKALVTIAPGHMMHVSNLLQTTTAADVQRAKNLVSIGEGNIVKNDFVTLNNGVEIRITTTANRYLTYHDLDVVPNLNFVLPDITLPVLWFAGDTDPLTALEGMEALAATITSTGSEYQALPGDHTSVVVLTPDPLDIWLVGLGL